MNLSNEITGVINVPFHGESAYEIAVRRGFIGTEEEWLESLGALNEEKIAEILENVAKRSHGYIWYVNTDKVVDKTGKSYGTMSDCMKDDFVGTWFYAVTTYSEAGSAAYPSKYTIDGANGYINLRDYVVWTGKRLVRVNTYEAKASTQKNSDGKYSPKSGVDGLMSSTDKAYLTDLINEYWDKNKLPVYPNPDPIEGWMCNWCRDDGIYLGGLKKDCGGHPPVLNDNHTSWVLMVFNGMATDHNTLNRNHRLQIAFDLVNSKIYMRRGWISDNTWADSWKDVSEIAYGAVTTEKLADGAVTEKKLSDEVKGRIIETENKLKYMNIGMNSLHFDDVSYKLNIVPQILNNTEIVVPISTETTIAYDTGFSVPLGTISELRDKNIIIHKNEVLPFENIALSAGKNWGMTKACSVTPLHVKGDYYDFSVNDYVNTLIENGKITEDFDGVLYLLIYNASRWDVSSIAETQYNRYKIFKEDTNLIYYKDFFNLEDNVEQLNKSVEEINQSTTEVYSMGNVLYGKKWVACGDSFTEGDFTGYTDENGLTGKNSPVIYDSEWGVYKTYPWWIARRNGMTLVNEAKCGSTMALSNEYVTDPDNYDISYRKPFSYQRYLNVPADADYITLMFGLNETYSTIGELTDTTNETVIGAWNIVLEYLITNMPYAKIGIIIPDAWLPKDFHDALVSVANYWGIPYLDLRDGEQVPMQINGRLSTVNATAKALRNNAFKVSESNGHPNVESHKYRSTIVENWLRSL